MQAAQPEAKVLSFSEKRRERREHEHRQELRRLGIHTRELVLMQREGLMGDAAHWHSLAMQWRNLADRENTLRQIAEIHLRASDTLLEFAYAEIERLKGLL